MNSMIPQLGFLRIVQISDINPATAAWIISLKSAHRPWSGCSLWMGPSW